MVAGLQFNNDLVIQNLLAMTIKKEIKKVRVLLFKKIESIIIELSKINLIRSCIPYMNTIHSAYIIGDKKAKILLDSARTGRRRAFFFWRWAPRKYCGGGFLNLIGFSFARYFYHNFRYRLRFCGKDFLYPELEKSGVQICPNLFSAELTSYILDFYQKHSGDVYHYFEDFSELIICNTKGPNHKNQDYYDFIDRILNENQVLKLGREVTGKKISIHPFISIIHYKSNPESKIQQDGQNIPHFDVFYPSYKLFVYLNQVTTDNGAFNYLAGSQAFSLKNAINYYKDTFRYYFGGGSKEIYPTDAAHSLYKNNYNWVYATGNPGDGVLFNVQGIHRRGEFKKDIFRERLVLLIDFRQAEVPIQRLAANA